MGVFDSKYLYIFQATTSIIVNLDHFTEKVEALWGVDDNLPSLHLKRGDGVLIKSVEHEGLVGYGEITRSWHRLDKPIDLGSRRPSRFAVKITYEGRIQPTLTTAEMREDPILGKMRIIKNAQGAFFPVTVSEKERLEELIGDRMD